jgi:hypothetical protein
MQTVYEMLPMDIEKAIINLVLPLTYLAGNVGQLMAEKDYSPEELSRKIGLVDRVLNKDDVEDLVKLYESMKTIDIWSRELTLEGIAKIRKAADLGELTKQEVKEHSSKELKDLIDEHKNKKG